MRRLLVALAAGLGLLPSCGGRVGDARPQWIVTVHTDVSVPQLGDRILVEVLKPNGDPACSGCRRLFGARNVEDWPFSFGLPDVDGSKRLLRVRLYRSDQSDSGGAPLSDLAMDSLTTLPDTGGDITNVDVVLALRCAGIPADVAGGRSCDPATGALGARTATALVGPAPRPGSAPEAGDVPCSRPAPPGMVCVPGALFARGSRSIPAPVIKMTPERLVRVSPFALDLHEVTVGELRALIDAGKASAPKITMPGAIQACSYTANPGEREDHPVNCITQTAAAAVCAARGLRLPTEAEWELAAGNRTRETRYPWGDDADVCAYATVGRGRINLIEVALSPEPSTACRGRPDGTVLPWGTTPVGESADVTDLGIYDLGGNVSEWVADAYDEWDGPCSSGPHVLVDPKCTVSPRGLVSIRGGAWGSLPNDATTTLREAAKDSELDSVGFRCATSL